MSHLARAAIESQKLVWRKFRNAGSTGRSRRRDSPHLLGLVGLSPYEMIPTKARNRRLAKVHVFYVARPQPARQVRCANCCS